MNKSTAGTPFEVIRRLLFFLLIILSVFAFTYAELSQSVVISQVEKEEVVPDSTDYGNSLIDKVSRIKNKAKEKIEEKKGQIKVKGTEWEEIFSKAEETYNYDRPAKGWENKITSSDLKFNNIYYIFFKPDEKPIASIYDKLNDGKSHLLKLAVKEPKYLEIMTKNTEIHGLNGLINDVPSDFAYPYRKYALALIVLAFVLYLIIPGPKKDTNTIRMKRGRIVLADFASYLLFLPFFALPFFIIGGVKAALGEYIIFTSVFWAVSILGLILIYWSIKYAKLEIKVTEEGFWKFGLGTKEEFKFSDIDYIQRAVISAPKKLTAATIISDVASPGGLSGVGLLTAVNSNGGLYIKTKDNRSAYIWYSDSFGNVMLKNFDVLINALEKNNIPVKEEMIDIRRVFPPEK
ncbi:MAG: hypothetical protein ACM3KR_10950 [Deltaproteobacteria bacterium]